MRPVDAQFPVSQKFGSYATAGVNPNQYGTEVQQLVYEYGNYQPFGHAGCDIACPIGTPVHAIAAGTVLWADWGTNLPGDDSDAGYRQRWYLYKTFPGIVTLIQHDGWISVYAHMSDAPLNPGDTVTEGQLIGLSGNTRSPGVSLAAHLHVGALVDLNYPSGDGLIYGCTDPEPFFGGIAAMSGAITPLEEDMPINQADADLIAKTLMDRISGESTIGQFLTEYRGQHLDTIRVAEGIPAKVLDTAVPGVMGDTQTLRQFLAESRDHHVQIMSGVPAAVLNQSFKLPNGTVTNLAGILSAIHAQPTAATGPGAATDPQAIVDAIVNGIQITRK